MKQQPIEITNKLGLHARAAAKFVTTASKYESEVLLGSNEKFVNGKSIMGVMMLAANKGTHLVIKVNGPDEDAALAELVELVNNKFDEEC